MLLAPQVKERADRKGRAMRVISKFLLHFLIKIPKKHLHTKFSQYLKAFFSAI